jgi:hypothetical protein
VKHHGGELWYCNSGRFEVKKGNEVILQANEWTRGLAIHKNMIFIGQSFRGNQEEISTGIYILNTVDRSHKFIPFPSKEIYEILVL